QTRHKQRIFAFLAKYAYQRLTGPSCPTGTTCVRPLRCDAVMQLYWKNLTLAMEMGPNWEIGSPLAALPSPLDVAFQRCWIFTEASGRSHHEGVCCQLDEPRELRPSDVDYVENNALLMFDPDDDVEKEDDEGQRQVTEDEQQQLSNDIEQDWRKSNIHIFRVNDIEASRGLFVMSESCLSSNESHIRTKRCLIGPECTVKDHRYRRFNGRCNNIHPGRSLWGSAGYPMERLLPPAYNNGVSSSRMLSNDGRYLPSSRVVSENMFSDLHIPHRRHNVLMMQLGQFLVHDISRNKATPINSKCCLPDNSHRNPHPHPACSPIRVSSKDSFYSQFNVKCLNFVRTVMAPLNQCHVGHGRQISEVTHFIDGSMIYGSSKQEADELRAHQGGRLKSLQHRQSLNELPPLDAPYVCTSAAKACFKAGDTRVNQVLTLVGFHTLFLREHNRIARKLEKINPHWSDDILFHETRRIVAAEFQHIIYNEYLPKVVGPDFMEMYDLHTSQGYSNFYNPEKNPALTSEFTTAAFRFGHSTVPGQFELPHGVINTHETFFNPSAITEPKFFDELFHGIMQQPMQKVDDMFTHSLTRFLNPEEGKPYGLDLAAINIQRGKDHAIRPYNYYLQLSGREVMRSFADFGPVHGPKLASLYSAPDDVDLYVGGILEQPVSGGVVGQTFAEIISDQFARLKQGDRYFYSNGRLSNPGHFTKPQLQELQKTTMAGIICANVNDKNSFEVALEALNLPHANKYE
ncbi:AAEL004401-PA, partial [Aedes aegypti]